MRSCSRLCSVIFLLSAFLPQAAQTAPLETWSWRNPLPQGNSISGLAFGNGLYVAIALGVPGTNILTSPDGVNWTLTKTPFSIAHIAYGNGIFVGLSVNRFYTSVDATTWTESFSADSSCYFNSVKFLGGMFITVGSGGIVFTSTDGISWAERVSGTSETLHSSTYGKGNWVAVGSNGTILTSVDGIDWVPKNSGTTATLRGASYGSEVFVVAGSGGQILTSSDAEEWSPGTSGISYSLYDVAYGNESFVAVGSGILTSSDGITWTEMIHSAGLNEVIFGSELFVVGGSGGTIFSSSDAIIWCERTEGIRVTLRGITHGNNLFVVVGDQGTILTSIDGTSWTQRDSGTSDRLLDIAFGNGTFVAVGGQDGPGGYRIILTSPDGINWTRADRTPFPAALSGITYGKNTFVAVGTSILTSSDGITWTEQAGFGRKVAFGNDVFVRVWGDPLSGPSEIFTSQDGLSWIQQETGIPGVLLGLTYGNARFVAVGGNRVDNWARSVILYSFDGITWNSPGTFSDGPWLNDIAYANGTFIAVSDLAANCISADGINWQWTPSGTVNFLYGVAYGYGTFITVGDRGTILQSEPFQAKADYNGDGKEDLVWRNPTTGRTTIWYMDGATWNGAYADILPELTGSEWELVGIADFNNDTQPDLLWRNIATGRTTIWYMNGSTWNGAYADVEPTLNDSGWSIVGIADFNRDGSQDLLWRNSSTGRTTIWYMTGPTWNGGYADVEPTLTDPNWSIVGIGDFNRDGSPDLLWRDNSTGRTTIWYMTGPAWNGGYADVEPTVSDPDWQIVAIRDFNGDGSPDLLWRNTANYRTTVWYMDGPTWNGNWGDLLPIVSDPDWIIVGR